MKVTIFMVTLFTVCSMMVGSYGGAQIKMNMSTSLDKKTMQLLDDLRNRRVSISPASITILNNSQTVSFEFHNPTDDTLELEIKISNSVPNTTKRIDSPDTKKAKSFLSEKEPEVTSVYKPLSEWIKDYPKKMILAPGEKKKVDIELAIPGSPSDGEYAAWVVAEVAPRKTLIMESKEKEKRYNSKGINKLEDYIAVSSGKLVYVAGINKSEPQETK